VTRRRAHDGERGSKNGATCALYEILMSNINNSDFTFAGGETEICAIGKPPRGGARPAIPDIKRKTRLWRPGLPVYLGGLVWLPCGGFGLARLLRDSAELLHQTQSVPVCPAFHDLAIREAHDADA
jgi:hypothetical protein